MKNYYIWVFLIVSAIAYPQQSTIDSLWKNVERHEFNDLPKSALENVSEIYTLAKQYRLNDEYYKSVLYTLKYTLLLDEDNGELAVIQFLEKEIAQTDAPVKNMLQSVLAQSYTDYLKSNYYSIINRDSLSNSNSLHEWDKNTFIKKIGNLYSASIENKNLLTGISLDKHSSFAMYNTNKTTICKTLYDILADNALIFFTSHDYQLNNYEKRDDYFNIKMLEDTASFLSINSDSIAEPMQQKALCIYQNLTRVHSNDTLPDSFIEVSLNRLNYYATTTSDTLTNSILLSTLYQLKEKYIANEAVASIIKTIAYNYYTAYKKSEDELFLDKALAECSEAISLFPYSYGAKECAKLKYRILQKQFTVKTKAFIPENTPSRIFVSSRNIDSLTINIYKIAYKNLYAWNTQYNDSIRKKILINSALVYSKKEKLPLHKHLTPKSTELLIPKLREGNYLIIASVKNDDINIEGISQHSIFHVSNLALLNNVSSDYISYQAIHRVNGEPIQKQQIVLESLVDSLLYKQNFHTDKNGFIKVKKPNKKYRNKTLNPKILAITENDTIPIGLDRLYENYNSTYEEENDYYDIKTHVFTDRGIYRPGQEVHYKVIATQTKNSFTTPFTNEFIEILLEDPNGQEVSIQNLKLNEFGSVSGTFRLPKNGLTGNYSIYVDESYEYDSNFYDNKDYDFDYQSYNFSVEAYKRPTFSIDFDSIQKAYKINDSITITGKANSFNGAPIQMANIRYAITRNTTTSNWGYGNHPYSNVEVYSGNTTTGIDGKFAIPFKAIVEKGIDALALPIFNFSITVSITDSNGETQTNSSQIQLGYHSIQTDIKIPEEININSNTSLQVKTRTLNGATIATKGIIKIYKVSTDSIFYKPRTWQEPDVQQIDEATFNDLFPNERYKKRVEIDWESKAPDYEVLYTTNTFFQLPKNISNHPENYLFFFETEDPSGYTIKDKKNVQIKNIAAQKPYDKGITLHLDKPSYNAGDKVEITLNSAIKNVWVTLSLEKDYKIIDTQIIRVDNDRQKITFKLPKNYTEGFAIQYHFSFLNWFSSNSVIIPITVDTNILETEIISFRDRISPGKKEEWIFKIKNDAKAEVLTSMYDSSLDEFSFFTWNIPNQKYYHYYTYQKSNAFGYEVSELNGLGKYSLPLQQSKPKQQALNLYGFDFTNQRFQYRRKLEQAKALENSQRKIYDKVVTGTVYDSDQIPLPGATILIKGTSYGSQTDFDGNFSIPVKNDDVLEINYLGFVSKQINLDSKSYVSAFLEADAAHLEEVVVVGYGIKKEALTSSVTTISMPVNDSIQYLFKSLEGKIAGLQINNNSNEVAHIQLRGNRSIDNQKEAIIVVDGVIATLDMLKNMDTDDITSINTIKGDNATALYGSRAANGVLVVTTQKGQEQLLKELSKVETRKNFSETAFFYPDLYTSKNGDVTVRFTTPEALTQWKLQLLAHTKKVEFGYLTLNSVTQKELMVTPNMPRFVREGDTITLNARIHNLTHKNSSGNAYLELINPITNNSIDSSCLLSKQIVSFNNNANSTANVSWKITVPKGIDAIQYKVIAKTKNFSDGEQNVIPVLPARILVTESIPIALSTKGTEKIVMPNLLNATSNTQHNSLTLELTNNPIWFAIQSLPYLIEYPFECAEQTFSRYYANVIANYIVTQNPKIKAQIETWKTEKNQSTPLEQNAELKSILIEETPWVLDAQTEKQRQEHLAQLLDTTVVAQQLQATLYTLKDMQLSNGGFPWFKGNDQPNRYITQHIIEGFANLKGKHILDQYETNQLVKKGVLYLDNEIKNDYLQLLNETKTIHKKDSLTSQKQLLDTYKPNALQLQYLLIKSVFNDSITDTKVKEAVAFYYHQSKKYWQGTDAHHKAIVALIAKRFGDAETAHSIIASLNQYSVVNKQKGMSWSYDYIENYSSITNVEAQSQILKAYQEISPDHPNIELIKSWLLQHKQLHHWVNTKATATVIDALLDVNNNTTSKTTYIEVGHHFKATLNTKNNGYINKKWYNENVQPDLGTIILEKEEDGLTTGALHWQYFSHVDSIQNSGTTVTVTKKLFLKPNLTNNDNLIPISKNTPVHIGDHILVKLHIQSNEALEFIHLKDMRAAGLEPLSTTSGYKWNNGLSYYESIRDASYNIFLDTLPKGHYTIVYELIANNEGVFSNGICTLESMYTTGIKAKSNSSKISIEQ